MYVGGEPARLMRFTATGRRIATALLAGQPVLGRADGLVARRLFEAGLAHPMPGAGPPLAITALVPVLDRTAELRRTLAGLGSLDVIVVDDGSADPGAIRSACAEAGATVIRLECTGGPAAARNRGLREVRSDAVLFLDSDVELTPGALEQLAGELADPAVVAVAPRLAPRVRDSSLLARHLSRRSPLDLGPDPALVRPGSRVSYLPTACLLVRTSALIGTEFAPKLRYGEDVDLIWRLAEAGGVIRYEPRITALHTEPVTWSAALSRRFRYGTAAGPLARRHPPGTLAPYRATRRGLVAVAALVLAPARTAALVLGGSTLVSARLAVRAGVPMNAACRYAVRASERTAVTFGRYALGVGLPLATATAALPGRRARRVAGLLSLALLAHLSDRRDGGADGPRTLGAALVDELAYAAGVWCGSFDARTFDPVLPRIGPLPPSRTSGAGPTFGRP